MAQRRAGAHLDAFFAAADTNKDGKLTKDEVANFVWKHVAKPDAQSVTKDELKAFAKQRMATMRAEGAAGHRHKHTSAKTKAGKSKKEEAKPKEAKPAAGAAEPKKADVKPVATAPVATTQTSPPVKPVTPTKPAAPVKPVTPAAPQAAQNGPVSPPVKKPAGVSKVDAGPPLGSATKNPGSKIGTSTTSRDVEAALFAARR
jgi:EF hand